MRKADLHNGQEHTPPVAAFSAIEGDAVDDDEDDASASWKIQLQQNICPQGSAVGWRRRSMHSKHFLNLAALAVSISVSDDAAEIAYEI